MKTLNAPDTISGKEGRAYAKVNGNNEELFMSKTIEVPSRSRSPRSRQSESA